jgi:hypothetical protein
MEDNCLSHSKTLDYWAASLILVATAIISVVAFVQWYDLSFFVGSLFFVHWLSIIGTAFIASLVPTYIVLKRTRPRSIKKLLKIHVFGNLLAFLLVSIHFAQNIGRLAEFYLKLDYGFILFIVLAVIVATGVIERFGAKLSFVRYIKPVHKYTVAVFYFVAVIHVLQSLAIS